jgi:guanidinopropionase
VSEPKRLRPIDSSVVPRDADVATFLRAQRTDDLELVEVGLLGVPLDAAAFKGGTRGGPAAVREASRAIRAFNPKTNLSPFEQAEIGDVGDVPVNILDYARSMGLIAEFVAGLRRAEVNPVTVGGDHSVTLGVLRGMAADRPLGVLQFDSHADIQDVFFGTKDSNASVMRRATEEGLIDPSRVVQIGLRGTRFAGSGDVDWGRDAGFTVIEFDDYEEMGRAAAIETILRVLGRGPTYITYDIDGLDPKEAPGTPAREPGGLSMRDSQVILRSIYDLDVVGADVCEVAPALDPVGLTATNAANLLFELTCLVANTRSKGR